MNCDCEQDQGILDWPRRRVGASLRSFTIPIAEENGTTLADAEIVFKLAGTDTAALTLNVDNGKLTLTSMTAGAWVITIEQIDEIALAAGVYYYQLKTVDADNATEFYVGGTWQIIDT